MSLILDALARAERDKQRAASPLPDLLQDSTIEADRDRRGLWLAIIVLGVVVVVLAVLYFRSLGPGPERGQGSLARVMNQQPPTSPADPAGAVDLSPTVSNAVPAAEVPSENLATPPGAGERAARDATGAAAAGSRERAAGVAPESVAALYSRGAPQAPTSEFPTLSQGPATTAQDLRTPQIETPADPGTVGARTGAEVARTRESAPDPEPLSAERIEEAIDIEAVLRDVRADAAAGALQPHSAPLLAELSQQFRDEVPTLMYLRHDFNPAGVSTVLLNGETLREGGRTRGVEVREILADSTVLLFRGQEFRLRALNSWVNL